MPQRQLALGYLNAKLLNEDPLAEFLFLAAHQDWLTCNVVLMLAEKQVGRMRFV
jgi:hypothetical protein